MARAALEQLRLDKMLWVPTGSTRYRDPPLASGHHRVAMLRLALEAGSRHEIDTREFLQGASGFTVDTLHELRLESGPDAALYLLLGADQFEKLGTWHRPDEVGRIARFAVFARPGAALKGPPAEVIAMPSSDISSSDIRARVARGEDISALVPASVAAYINEHGLYRVRDGLSG
jgi:nicotinate-nucleotide adenylyltransferase